MAGCSDKKDEPEEPETPAESNRTILVYMIATNTLSGYDSMDMQEMMLAAKDIDLKKYSLLIYHCSKSTNPKLIKLTSKRGVVETDTIMEYNDDHTSVEVSRISEVINDMKELAPAKEYGIVFWSHATSWTPSFLLANNPVSPTYFGDDYGKHINIDQLADAIPDKTFSFIWMDCCFMAGIECIYEMRNKCDWYIGYPTEILSNGMPYHLTLPLLTQETADIIGAADATFNYFNTSTYNNSRYCTISVIDMSKIEQVADATQKVLESFSPINTSDLQIYSRGSHGPFYDFNHYVSNVAAKCGTTNYLPDFENALNNAVVYKNCTDKFINISIDANLFSGISTHAIKNDNSQKEEYYMTLDWYKRVYPTTLK